MKIGILTFHRSQNYGALLQAKGLQDYARELGYNVSFVDYWPEYHEEMYKPFSWNKFRRYRWRGKLKYLTQLLFTYSRLKKRRLKTKEYIKNFLTVSGEKSFDVVLYGSDQIWRKQHQPTYDWFNPVYWGEGEVETENRIAYAASMGQIEIDTPADRQFVFDHLKLYKAISIREKDLIERLEQDYGVRYKMVCDPVFLLTKEQWLRHVEKKYQPPYKYILYYRLQAIKETDRMVEELVKKTGLKVIEMRSYMPYFHYGSRYRLTADAQEFISLIQGAEYVVTSAFHGIAMSIIFEKQFFFTSQRHQANRVESLFTMLGLEDRFADGYQNSINLDNPIDYVSVKKRLEPFADSSRQWLRKQLEDAESNH